MRSCEVALPRHNKELDRAIIRQVLGYFVRNPKAVDTLEGVARWRLLEERVHESVRQTKAAIDWLVKEGYLEEVVTPGGKAPVFRMKAERKDDAIQFLS
jgi:hypothetical protein